MTAFTVARSSEPIGQLLSADEYDALPENSQRELVDGVIHVMATPTPWHQDVVHALVNALRHVVPPAFRVTREVEVRLADLLRRNPDVLVVRAEGFNRRVAFLRPEQVLLAVEVVSPGSESADRVLKPLEYARAGIPFYWRVESGQYSVDVRTYRLADDWYQHTGTFGAGETVVAPGLDWARFGVSELVDED